MNVGYLFYTSFSIFVMSLKKNLFSFTENKMKHIEIVADDWNKGSNKYYKRIYYKALPNI